MASDLFEKLADLPVPPVPPTFDRAVHERINKRLLIGQFLDVATARVCIRHRAFRPRGCGSFESERNGEVRVGISGGFPAGAMNCAP